MNRAERRAQDRAERDIPIEPERLVVDESYDGPGLVAGVLGGFDARQRLIDSQRRARMALEGERIPPRQRGEFDDPKDAP